MNNKYLELFKDYLIEIKLSKALGTFNFYRSNLLHIGRFFYEQGVFSLYEVDKMIIVDYISLLRGTVESSTINKRVGIIKRCFLYYGIDEHYIHSVEKYKERKRSFDMIDENDLKNIIQYVNSLDNNLGNNLMHKGIILLLINTGVRVSELYNIEKKNVNLANNEILLTKTKNGQDRVVYFISSIKKVLSELISEKSDHKFLLHNRLRNRAINYTDLKQVFTRLKEDLNIKKIHAHMFRHTFATKLLRSGVDIKTVMDLMGHNNLSTTQRYQHSSKEHAKKSYLKKYSY